MRSIKGITAIAVIAGVAATAMAPLGAHADSTQNNKNLWRNLAIGSGVVAAHGLVTHNGTEALLGVAGTAYTANRYEQERRSQSRQSHWRHYHHWHHYHH